ncbi:MAG: outer membrane protein assembly factor BamB family protein [Planctomycetota bacterium]|jgi:outer membrane protein assembly factor BamB
MTKHRYIIRAALIAAVLLTHSGSWTRANEPIWPQFRGPNCSGHAAEGQNPPVEFGPEQNLLWKTPVQSGHSSPCIWRDHIFLTSFDKEKKELQVFCLERSSGKIQWRQVVPAEEIEKVLSVSSPAAPTAAADGERVYVYFGSYGLLCYDFAGNHQWGVPLPASQARYGHCSSPIVLGELVVLSRLVGNDPCVLAVDRKSGKTVWKESQQRTRGSHSTPIVWEKHLVIHLQGMIKSLDPSNGARIWSVSAATAGVSTPVIGNNVLFVGAWGNFGEEDLRVTIPDFKTLVEQYDRDGDTLISKSEFPEDLAIARRPELLEENIEGSQFYLKQFFRGFVDRSKDGQVDEAEWKKVVETVGSMTRDHGLTAIKPGGKDDITDTHILWQEKTNVAEVPSPLYCDGRVYMIKNGGITSCMDAESGKLLYRQRLGAAGPYYSSPICANGRIYIASGKGVITIFAAGDTLQVLARNNLKEQVFATPAVVENKIYVRTAKHIYAFGE